MINATQLIPMSEDETAALLFICGDQYLFRHRTENGGTAYKFLSSSAVRAAFAEEAIDTGWLPSNVRRCGMAKRGEWVMVAHPSQSYTLSMLIGEGEEPTTLEVPMPRLTFLGYEHRYYIWAFKDRELRGDTMLFAAPLPNIDANGAICFGTNLVPNATPQTVEEAWQVFLASPFNRHAVDRKSRAFPQDVRAQLQRLAVERHRRYPISDLVSTRRTANSWVDSVLHGFD